MSGISDDDRHDVREVPVTEYLPYLKENRKRNFWLLIISWLLISITNPTDYVTTTLSLIQFEMFRGSPGILNRLPQLLEVAGLIAGVLYGAGKLPKMRYLVKPLVQYGRILIAASAGAAAILLFAVPGRIMLFTVWSITFFVYALYGLFTLTYLLLTVKTVFIEDRGKLFGYRHALMVPANFLCHYPLYYLTTLILAGRFSPGSVEHGRQNELSSCFPS
jgi:hypothetical protein